MRKSIIASLTLCVAMGPGMLTRSQRSQLILDTGIRSRRQKLPDLVSFQLNFEYRRTLSFMTACTSASRSAAGALMA